MISADLALAGVTSTIPCDEVIEAMFRIGQTMPVALRETAEGGLAERRLVVACKKRFWEEQ